MVWVCGKYVVCGMYSVRIVCSVWCEYMEMNEDGLIAFPNIQQIN